MRLALLLLLALPAAAQPSASAVLEAWADGWERAAQGVRAVEAREVTEWTVDGPRGRTLVESEGRIRFGDGPPERSPERVRVDGADVEAERGPRQGRRWQRAFGPGGREVHAPPPLPDRILRDARALGIEADRLDGVPVWRVRLGTRADRADAWFTRSEAPRLLMIRLEGDGRHAGLEREIRFTRVSGLDLPSASRTTLTVQQRRRLREYFVTLTAVGAYTRHTLR